MKALFGRVLFLVLTYLVSGRASCAGGPTQSNPGEDVLKAYFRVETEELAARCLEKAGSLEAWKAERPRLREQLFEMLSLSPTSPRTELKPVLTGKLEEEAFTVEKLHFQSMPGLYVTANLYLPKRLEKPAPAILYVCGHAFVITNGVSYGNKTAYQHHGAWFARNGYVCLILDTVQLGEIQGLHHGTYREKMWWWNSRGYTPAGVEAWNCIRALDYLQSRPEVDGDRLGVTGRSGGGAYSWWVAALDDRIRVAAPVAGITDLQNHVVDGTVEGHCDCMFMVNTYRWDYPTVAALVAPRPLLICNSDKDSIFPLEGVVRVHSKVAKIYALYGATNNLGLLITEGPHKDTQDLQLPVFRWFNRHLKHEDPRIELAAKPFFSAAQLKVFDTLPSDERTSKIHESFVPVASAPELPAARAEWDSQRDQWKDALREHVFRGWPEKPEPLHIEPVLRDGLIRPLEIYTFVSQHDVQLRLYVRDALRKAQRIQLTVLSPADWANWVTKTSREFPDALHDEAAALGLKPGGPDREMDPRLANVVDVFFVPRGIGLSAWDAQEPQQTQIRRRFMLLGQTLEGMRVWDIRRAIQALKSIQQFKDLPVTVQSTSEMGANCVYAALFEPGLGGLVLSDLPRSHQRGSDYLNVLRFLDIPQALAMAAESCPVFLRGARAEDWRFPAAVASRLGWDAQQFRITE